MSIFDDVQQQAQQAGASFVQGAQGAVPGFVQTTAAAVQTQAPAIQQVAVDAGYGAGAGARAGVTELDTPTKVGIGVGAVVILGLVAMAVAKSGSAADRAEGAMDALMASRYKETTTPGNPGQYGTKVTTDGRWRELLSAEDVPAKVRAEHPDAEQFVQWRREYYPLSSFTRGGIEGWDGSLAYGRSSGLLVKLKNDGTYQIGSWMLTSSTR